MASVLITTGPAAPQRIRRLGLSLALVLSAVATAWAHAELVRAVPTADAVLSTAPSQITLTFSGPVDVPPDAIAVFAPDGERVDRRRPALREGDNATIEATLGPLASGTHTVRWRAVSEDGHPIEGAYQFSIGAATTAVAPRDEHSRPSGIWPAAGRALHLAALSVVVGPFAFLIIVRPDQMTMRRRLWRLLWMGSLLLIPAAVLMLVAQSWAVAGSLDAGLRSTAVNALLATRWGQLWSVRSTMAMVTLAFATWGWRHSVTDPERPPVFPMLGIALAVVILITATALNGHSAVTEPVWLSLILDWVHVAATAVWVGGLASLAWAALPAVRESKGSTQDLALASLIPRFSTVAVVCVELLVFTGLYHAWAHVDRPESLTATIYGRTLMVKLAVLAVMLLPAAVNLLVLRPRLAVAATGSSNGTLLRAFRRSVYLELAVGAVLIAVVGRLTSVPPASAEAAAARVEPAAGPAERGVTVAGQAGPALVLFTMSPLRVGANRLQVQVQDAGGASLAKPQVRLRLMPPSGSGLSAWSVTPAVDGSGYSAAAAFAAEGMWAVEVEVTPAGGSPASASFTFTLPVRGAQELLVASTEHMNRLRSAVEQVETFADGIRTQARVEHEAPDRERWQQTSGGTAEEVTVGGNRYVLQDAVWTVATAPAVQWPAFSVHPSSDDPVLVGREPIDGVDCFVVAYTDSEDGSHHRAWIATEGLLLMQHVAAAPGRVVVSRYEKFDQPLRIAAPAAGVAMYTAGSQSGER